jgi:hypothetical protein
MVFHDLYCWLGKINELKDRNKYYTPVFNALKYSRDQAVPCDNLTSNRPSLLFVSKSRSPLTSLNKGGDKKSSQTPPNSWEFRGSEARLQATSIMGLPLKLSRLDTAVILPDICT